MINASLSFCLFFFQVSEVGFSSLSALKQAPLTSAVRERHPRDDGCRGDSLVAALVKNIPPPLPSPPHPTHPPLLHFPSDCQKKMKPALVHRQTRREACIILTSSDSFQAWHMRSAPV